MGIFSFISNIGKALTEAASKSPTVESLKKELDSHSLGTDKLDVSLADGKVLIKGHVKNQEVLEKAILALGNIQGIESVNSDGVTFDTTDEKESVFYTVRSGDTLWKIAESQYGKGKGNMHTVIFEANTPMLTSPDKIYPGQVLRIPPLKG